MQIEVYPTDAEALDAAAALAAERLRAAGGPVTVAIGGGRTGRGLMIALAARGDVPWGRVDWYLADERCTAPGDPLAHAQVARASLFVPRGVEAARIHVPVVDAGDPREIARRWAAMLGAVDAFDLVLLGISADGSLGQLAPGGAALAAGEPVAVVTTPGEPPRVSLAPTVLRQARHAIVTAVGPETAPVVAAALREGAGPPAQLLPSDRVTWVVDRDAASTLLAEARPAEAQR